MQRRKLKPTLAKTGSAKENQPGRKERKRGKTEGKTKRRAKLTLQSNARNPLLQATCGHTATAHSRKDRRGGAELDHKYRFRKHPCANTCKTRGSTCFGLRQDFPSQPTQRPFWTKVAKTWKKKRDFSQSNSWQKIRKQPNDLRNQHFKRVLATQEDVGGQHRKNVPRSAGFLSRWPPDCRTEGIKTAKHYKNRGLGTTTWPTRSKTSIFELKNALRTREQGIFSKIEASKRGF